VKTIFNFLAVILLVMPAAGVPAQAQNTLGQTGAGGTQSAARSSPAVDTKITASLPANQTVVNSLSSLPEADTLIYINPQRILNEVVPKFLPAKDVEGMRKGFEEVRKNAGLDPTKVDYVVFAVRFKKPTAELNYQLPEFLVVTSGDFSADSLMALARMAAQGKLRDEKYGTKTLSLMTIDPIVKEAERNAMLKPFSEMGIVSLNANTIAAGSPAYLRAAIDAGDGKERISVETLNSLVRDQTALISIAGTPWHSFAKSFGMLGTEANARAARCESKMGDFYAAITMDATNFMLRGAMNADNLDTAKIIRNLFSTLLQQAVTSIKDPSAQTAMKGLALSAEGDEVMLRADIPQQMVIDLIQRQMKPKPAVTVTEPANMTTKPSVKPRRRTRRRSVRH
jgi:hypothetical protein